MIRPQLFKGWITLSTGYIFNPMDSAIVFPHNHLATVVQKLDSAIHWINHYPVDK